MSKKLPSEQDLRKAFQAELQKSGFLFENKVGKVFKKNKFHLRREVPYLDKENEKSGRTIDFIAEAGILVDRFGINKTTINMGDLKLIIECKNNPNYAWIFFEGKHNKSKPAEELYFKNPKRAEYKFLPKAFIDKLFFASSYKEILYPLKKGEKKHNSPEKLFEAIAQVTKATRYRIDLELKIIEKLKQKGFSDSEARPNWDFIIFQPLIVFGGNLYKINESDENLKPVDFVQIDKTWLSSKYEEVFGEIHIVSLRALQKYIDILRKNYDFINNPKKYTNKQYEKFRQKIKEEVNSKSKKKKWNFLANK